MIDLDGQMDIPCERKVAARFFQYKGVGIGGG